MAGSAGSVVGSGESTAGPPGSTTVSPGSTAGQRDVAWRCYVYRCQLRWADFDAYRHVNNVRYLELFQDARIDFANSVLPDPRGLESATVVARQEVDYLVPIGYRPGTVDVAIRVTRIGGSSATVAFEVVDSTGQPGLRGLAQPARDTARDTTRDTTRDMPRDTVPDAGSHDAPGDGDQPVVYARGSCVVVAYDLAAGTARRLTAAEREVFALISGPAAGLTSSGSGG